MEILFTISKSLMMVGLYGLIARKSKSVPLVLCRSLDGLIILLEPVYIADLQCKLGEVGHMKSDQIPTRLAAIL